MTFCSLAMTQQQFTDKEQNSQYRFEAKDHRETKIS